MNRDKRMRRPVDGAQPDQAGAPQGKSMPPAASQPTAGAQSRVGADGKDKGLRALLDGPRGAACARALAGLLVRQGREQARARCAGLAQAQRARWQAQEAEAQAVYPDCVLARELQNPHFVRLITDRACPLTVRQAYEAVHLAEIRRDIERAAAMRVFEALRRQGDRPRESGAAPQAGLPIHAQNMTRRERAALARRAAAGERITL